MPSRPFASLAFLSGLPPAGASTGAALGAGLWPIDPARRGASLWPIDPSNPGAGLWPIDPARRLAALWPIDPSSGLWPIDPSSAQWPIDPSSAQWPIDPSRARARAAPASAGAAWAEEQSVLSQALRQSRARIVRSSDAVEKVTRVKREALWRWAADSRVKTIACEMIQRFAVHERQLWLTAPLGTTGSAAAPRSLYPLPDPLKPSQLADQIDKVLRAASEREDRMAEVLAQAPDFQAFFESITGLSLERAPRLGELIAVVQDAAVHLVMLLKHVQAAKRPVEVSSRVMPMIATPGHGALPSGHATMAALTSELLHLLLYSERPGHEQRSVHLDRLARRIAFNRVVAGVHFPADSKAGYALGTQLARVFAALAGALKHPPLAVTTAQVGGTDLDLPEVPAGANGGRPALQLDTAARIAPAPLLRLLWREVADELDQLRV